MNCALIRERKLMNMKILYNNVQNRLYKTPENRHEMMLNHSATKQKSTIQSSVV